MPTKELAGAFIEADPKSAMKRKNIMSWKITSLHIKKEANNKVIAFKSFLTLNSVQSQALIIQNIWFDSKNTHVQF